MVRLSHEDWEKLDALLQKVGFGGYYDVIEVLKDTVRKLEPRLDKAIESESDLLTLITLIHQLSKGSRKSQL